MSIIKLNVENCQNCFKCIRECAQRNQFFSASFRGEDLEGSAQGSKPQALTLRASCQGEGIPLGFPLFEGLF